MEKQIIISIGREFGSGGHEIAEKIANHMGLAFYDRRLLDELAQQYGLDPKELEKYDEKPRNFLLSRKVRGHSNSIAEAVASLQFKFLKEKADAGESFVIVGRCAEVVLADYEALISIFIRGEQDEKLKRVMEKYHLDEEEASAKIKRHDRKRKAYHDTYSPYCWGNSKGYDLCINSSKLEQDKVVDIIERFIRAKQKYMLSKK